VTPETAAEVRALLAAADVAYHHDDVGLSLAILRLAKRLVVAQPGLLDHEREPGRNGEPSR
jgi:hypothetical protein